MRQETENQQESSALAQTKKLKRLSRRKRTSNPPSMILQERDREIILAVYRYRFLTREQIERLFFSTTARANHRLKKLFHNGYLNRIFVPVATGSPQAIYSLAEKGVQEVAIGLGIDRDRIRWQKNNGKVKSLFLEHFLAVNDFHLALEAAIRQNSNHQLLHLFSEEECKDTFNAWDERKHQQVTKSLNPDGYGQYRFNDRFFSFFLEMDRGTMSNRRFKEKILRYQQ